MDHRVHDNSPAPLAAIDGTTLVAMMAAGLDRLDARVADIDRLNLFPVPDRDTGTNMVQTLRASVNGLITIPGNAAEAAGLIARQGLYAARGNSGVILAQFMRGFADATGERITLDTAALARAVSGGAKAAWEAVDVPVEGTVLTVMRSAAEAASAAARRGEAVDRLLQSALYAAVRALEQTREQLPTLARAGVVDAGGAGFVLILEGMTAHLSPDLPIETASLFTSAPPDVGAETGTAPYGFCTEFLITGSSVDAASVRSVIADCGDSLLVVGVDGAVRVHVHTRDPDVVLERCSRFGTIGELSVVDMDRQIRNAAQEYAAGEIDSGQPRGGPGPEEAPLGVVAMVDGEGFEKLCRSLGAAGVVRTDLSPGPDAGPDGNQVEPADELLRLVERLPHREVIILPNSIAALEAAQSAVRRSRKSAAVAACRSAPAAVAALVEWNMAAGLGENLAKMNAAVERLHLLEIHRQADGVSARFDGSFVDSDGSVERLLSSCLRRLADPVEAVTIYYPDAGANGMVGAATEAIEKLVGNSIEVEVVRGGQRDAVLYLTFE